MYAIRGVLFALGVIGAIFVAFAIVALIADWVDLTIFGLLLEVGFILVWAGGLYDIWRRADLSNGSRVLWSGLIIVFPFVGTVVYALTRPPAAEVSYRGEQPA